MIRGITRMREDNLQKIYGMKKKEKRYMVWHWMKIGSWLIHTNISVHRTKYPEDIRILLEPDPNIRSRSPSII